MHDRCVCTPPSGRKDCSQVQSAGGTPIILTLLPRRRRSSLAKFAAMRRASSRVSRLVAERRCDAAICPQMGDKWKPFAHARNDVNDPKLTLIYVNETMGVVIQTFFCTRVIRWFGTGPTLLISNTSRGFSAIALIWITLSPSLALAQFI